MKKALLPFIFLLWLLSTSAAFAHVELLSATVGNDTLTAHTNCRPLTFESPTGGFLTFYGYNFRGDAHVEGVATMKVLYNNGTVETYANSVAGVIEPFKRYRINLPSGMVLNSRIGYRLQFTLQVKFISTGYVAHNSFIACSGPLPVTLVSFTVGKNGAAWQTATEVNSQDFTVEHSQDGALFKRLVTQPAAGPGKYIAVFVAQPGYYRLASRDLDGTIAYSNVVVFAQTSQAKALAVYDAVGRSYRLGTENTPGFWIVKYDDGSSKKIMHE